MVSDEIDKNEGRNMYTEGLLITIKYTPDYFYGWKFWKVGI